MKSSWEPLEMLSSYITREQNDSWTYKPKSPTHVTVLGDLFSSQWIDDNEFNVRLARYQSIFPDPATAPHSKKTTVDKSDGIPILINITGNHDIGYGNDISQTRLDRWEQVFGRSNFIESMAIPDSAPLKDPQAPGHSRNFISWFSTPCFWTGHHQTRDNTIIEQTMLTPNSTTWILNNIKPDFVLNGHDHYGCDIVHVRSRDEGTGELSWMAHSTSELSSGLETKAQEHDQIDRQDKISIREVTQRSMMAEFGGYAGLFEARISETNPDRIEFHYSACGFYNDLQVWIMIVTIAIVVGAWVLIISARALAALYRILISKTRKHQGSTEEKLKKL
ncbi:hypothetical protein BGX21_003826 [Mortierella sp. AD011]|nr:hypothetical protein BGX21_003826 [Mortierella sp. AD011]